MRVLALYGESNIRKTSSLLLLYKRLLTNGYVQVKDHYRYISNGDIFDVLEKEGNLIGIITQGDYVKGSNSVKNHLKNLKIAGCQKAIYAASQTSNKIQPLDQVKCYSSHIIIPKTIEIMKSKQLAVNSNDANLIFNMI
ncbi:EutP/PduV family microcompartment system protein [Plebeiibacterium sediminum]|uniref:Uncharacterized protein n=1 Tax=Plebeiibacterium sediminum TaxID=2992112 RepID=A0AAE3M9V4_9BACT|nr:EutP/PduV family microcompartment system protein [Plebeiobacterium sediminum]MCW3789485.1 hypothetical protein [Plebeiobacterium sediminum]